MFKLKIVTDKRTRYVLTRDILMQDGYLGWENLQEFGEEVITGRTVYKKEEEGWKLVSDTGFTEKLIFLQIDDEIVIGGTK
ncbi:MULTISPECIES: hypothetical protein [Fusobacterium]|uniref:Uncharacterized protein n=1 Tax=Fusobacterium equinum TaxID=134605 RepID=A0A133N9L3_9FUSO|nr:MULTISPECIES: hypothetical protein [Fusobacterium]EFS23438.1 hypothetical protein FSEG_01045 [Fusobacterium necrophorum D12]KXA12979.1 hypothetical protein HMPREF3206_01656 [Fusobacterium equinum]